MMTSVKMREGSELTLHQGQTYTLDNTNEYVQTLLNKKDANGMAASWLVEIHQPLPEQPEKPDTEKEDALTTSTTTKRK
jgi:hypothetical protein